jgi:hypothetical protein
MLCEYGCGKEARFQLKNRKWCCSKFFQKCNNVRMKYSRKKSVNEINKISEKVLEYLKKESSEEKECRIKRQIESQNTKEWKENASRVQKEQWSKNEEGKKILSQKATKRMMGINVRKNLSIKQTERFKDPEERRKLRLMFCRTIESIKEEIPEFLEVEELRYDPERLGDKIIQAHCKNKDCQNSKEKGGWFTPRNVRLTDRIFVFKKGFGNSYLFCSEKCKIESEVFGRQIDLETLSRYLKYRKNVELYTSRSVRNYKDKIKNVNLRGRKNGFELDHKYSVKQGFLDNVNPKIVGHYKNLEVISKLENNKKYRSCSINLEDLLNIIKEV